MIKCIFQLSHKLIGLTLPLVVVFSTVAFAKPGDQGISGLEVMDRVLEDSGSLQAFLASPAPLLVH